MTTRIQLLEQQARALELRVKQGASIAEIADRLGITTDSAKRRVQAALRAIPVESADEVRRTVETRYDALLKRLNALLETGRLSPMETVQVVNSIGQLEDRRVRLLGLAVPAAVVLQLEQQQGGY